MVQRHENCMVISPGCMHLSTSHYVTFSWYWNLWTIWDRHCHRAGWCYQWVFLDVWYCLMFFWPCIMKWLYI